MRKIRVADGAELARVCLSEAHATILRFGFKAQADYDMAHCGTEHKRRYLRPWSVVRGPSPVVRRRPPANLRPHAHLDKQNNENKAPVGVWTL